MGVAGAGNNSFDSSLESGMELRAPGKWVRSDGGPVDGFADLLSSGAFRYSDRGRVDLYRDPKGEAVVVERDPSIKPVRQGESIQSEYVSTNADGEAVMAAEVLEELDDSVNERDPMRAVAATFEALEEEDMLSRDYPTSFWYERTGTQNLDDYDVVEVFAADLNPADLYGEADADTLSLSVEADGERLYSLVVESEYEAEEGEKLFEADLSDTKSISGMTYPVKAGLEASRLGAELQRGWMKLWGRLYGNKL